MSRSRLGAIGRCTRAALAATVGAALCVGPAGAAVTAHPQIAVGGFPTGITLDPLTQTIYVADGSTNALSLIDAKTCNARTVSGCSGSLTAVTAGADPIGSAVDESTRTLYVANSSGTVAVLNDRRCDVADIAGCHVEPATVRVGSDPQFVAVNEDTDTIYVANVGSDTVSVIDGATCNAASTAGCGRPQASVAVGPGPFALAIDERTNTIYVADLRARTVSVIDGRHCDSADIGGCGRRPLTSDVGDWPGGIALDERTNTVYVTGQSSDEVWVIDGNSCNGSVSVGCKRPPGHLRAGAGARGIAADDVTDTIYVANTFADTVSVINGASCNATVRSGCGQHAAVAPVGVSPRRIAVSAGTNSIYVTNAGSDTVTILDGRSCDGTVHRGCGAGSASSRHPGLPVA